MTGCARRASAAARPRKVLAADRRGATAVEFALVLPPFVLTVFGIIQFSMALWTQNQLNYAVEQAARCAAVNTISCATTLQVQNYASGLTSNRIAANVFNVSTAACGHVVSATYPMTLPIPYFNFAPTLSAQSCYP